MADSEMSEKKRVGLIAAGLIVLCVFLWRTLKVEAEPTVYICPYCNTQFATEKELLHHVEQEHPDEPPIKYVCPHCGAEFSTEGELLQHIEQEHPPLGYMEGYVLNAVTGAKLPRGAAMLTIDGTQIIYNDLGVGGAYPYFRAYLQHGRSYHFTVEASGYYTGEFDVFMPTKYDRHSFKLVPWEGSD